MSRFVESKIPELDGRIENIERQNWYLGNELRNLRRTDDIIKELRIENEFLTRQNKKLQIKLDELDNEDFHECN